MKENSGTLPFFQIFQTGFKMPEPRVLTLMKGLYILDYNESL